MDGRFDCNLSSDGVLECNGFSISIPDALSGAPPDDLPTLPIGRTSSGMKEELGESP